MQEKLRERASKTPEKSFKQKEVSMIMRVSRLHHSAVEKNLKALNIHRGKHMLLMAIAREGELLSQRQIAERLEISAAAVAMCLKKLETNGYITRQESESDGRVNHISISEKGSAVINQSENIVAEIDNAMLKGISDEQLAVFSAVLDKMQDNLIAVGAEDRHTRR